MTSVRLDRKFRILILLLTGISLISGNSIAQIFPDDLTGDYLGQKKPGLLPVLFAPDIITTDTSEGCSGWGNNMEFFVFQRWMGGKSVLYIMYQYDGKWTKPERIAFADKYQIPAIQLVLHLKREKRIKNVEVRRGVDYLSSLLI